MRISSQLLDKIRLRKGNLTVLGLGHVGLPTALIFACAGFHVTGIDTDARKLNTLKRGVCYIREPGIQETLTQCLKAGTFRPMNNATDSIRTSNFVSICVPTPVKHEVSNLSDFKAAFATVKTAAHAGLLVLIESTLPLGTTSNFAVPELQRLGYRMDEDVFMAYCPERLAPGHALKDFASNTRIIGGVGPESGKIASELLKTVCRNVVITDAATAELSKLAENTFRDLNIAYANLLALIAENSNVDAKEVIELANTHPRVTIHTPGLGVGGPCLPKDPYMLIEGAPEDTGELVRLGRRLNEHMTDHAIDLLSRVLASKHISMRGAKIAVLGVAYKPDIEDVTYSPAKSIVGKFLGAGATVYAYDPYASETFGAERVQTLAEALRDAHCVVIATAHTDFKSINPNLIRQLAKPQCVVFDGPRLLDAASAEDCGLIYLGTGYRRNYLGNNRVS
jgi:UDP-N-acetyl-D-mannosaminuronic acid dehydrogenase